MQMSNSANVNAYNKQIQETKDEQQEISESETTSLADFL